MNNLVRQEVVSLAQLVVVKVGTRVLTRDDGTLNEERIARLAEEINALIETGRRVVLVSSGAVSAGISQLGLSGRPTDLAKLQAVAAVGQTRLIEVYDRTLRKHGRRAAQVLLTADDLDHRIRYLNVRNTLLMLLQLGAIPIINENDTVAIDELMTTFGDNDRLAAMVTNLLRAPLLIILSDVEGLYDGDPADPSSRVISVVTQLDQRTLALARDRRSGLSKGGMASKLAAARIVTQAGENMIIASGSRPGVLADVFQGREVGTLILAQGKTISPWKRWIAFSAKPRGQVMVDAGARTAIAQQGKSLLAIGIQSVQGPFDKGDVISICDGLGNEFARGLTNYRHAEIELIRGLPSDQIGQRLGHRQYEEVIHRDNLCLLDVPGQQ
jgi:glutamate 5-kinase